MTSLQKILENDKSAADKILDAGIRAVSIFDSFLDNGKQTKESKDYGCFQYVTFDEKKFLFQLYKAMLISNIINKNNIIHFVDVGCGIGTKVFLASAFFNEAHGIEIDDNYITIGQNIIRNSSVAYTNNIKLMKRDALEFSNYRDYDVIYLYRPFYSADKQNLLEEKIAKMAKENTIIIGMLCNFYKLHEDIRPKLIFDNVYIKTNDQKLIEFIKIKLTN